MQQVENELHTKMSSLQFVTPAHLEITCLKEAGTMDIDLSYTIQQLKSIQNIEVVSSPRQPLRGLDNEEKEMLVGELKGGEELNNEVDFSYDDALAEESGKATLMRAFNISARRVREARSLGQTVELDKQINFRDLLTKLIGRIKLLVHATEKL